MDNLYKHMPLVGFVVYLRPRFRLLLAGLIGWGLCASLLVEDCRMQRAGFAHVSTLMTSLAYLSFLRQLIANKARLFSTEVPPCIWISGLAAVTLFVVAAIAKTYLG